MAAGRKDLEQLEVELKQTPAQLLIGVRTQTVPDRGILRQISRLAEATDGGVIIQLLNQDSFSEDLESTNWIIGAMRWQKETLPGWSRPVWHKKNGKALFDR